MKFWVGLFWKKFFIKKKLHENLKQSPTNQSKENQPNVSWKPKTKHFVQNQNSNKLKVSCKTKLWQTNQIYCENQKKTFRLKGTTFIT